MEDSWVRDSSNFPEKESGNPAARELELSGAEIKVAHGRMEAGIGDRLNQTSGSQPWLHSLPGGAKKRVVPEPQPQTFRFQWPGRGPGTGIFFLAIYLI